ncbi:hypothetical protein PYW07_009828 [Mythimna separata]|uniref:Macro domain-containing protein n=1 Tax=Mythimna separata TaxID=271217 RepID=A0AAD7YGD8_MYTSE|nr:hypothetical protein PYW07_009828 [Mythimna separata]
MNTLEEYQSTSALNTPRYSSSPAVRAAGAGGGALGLAAGRPAADAARAAPRLAHEHAGGVPEHLGSQYTQVYNSPLATFSPEAVTVPSPAAPTGERLEESFTIHLGSQLKQTHNIRIVAMDLLDLCSVEQVDNPTESSRRLQTSLSLYSSELAGVVLLTESPPRRPVPPTTLLLDAAARSTEHHFADVEHQLRDISERVQEPVERRNKQRVKEQAESASCGAGGSGAHGGARFRSNSKRNLQTGDIFITRHSNLAEVHVVFHLIVDDSSLRSGDITSRHPAILGLRNILKAACSNDITSISIPLLLRHEMSEEMTAAWCARRAELVLKCVKGFMLEAAGWGGAELRTLHFALPPRAAPALFTQLATLTPNIFRISNPVKCKPKA